MKKSILILLGSLCILAVGVHGRSSERSDSDSDSSDSGSNENNQRSRILKKPYNPQHRDNNPAYYSQPTYYPQNPPYPYLPNAPYGSNQFPANPYQNSFYPNQMARGYDAPFYPPNQLNQPIGKSESDHSLKADKQNKEIV